MKTNKDKKQNKKFDLEKMKVAKLENLHLINGGDGDDPIDTNKVNKLTTKVCEANNKA